MATTRRKRSCAGWTGGHLQGVAVGHEVVKPGANPRTPRSTRVSVWTLTTPSAPSRSTARPRRVLAVVDHVDVHGSPGLSGPLRDPTTDGTAPARPRPGGRRTASTVSAAPPSSTCRQGCGRQLRVQGTPSGQRGALERMQLRVPAQRRARGAPSTYRTGRLRRGRGVPGRSCDTVPPAPRPPPRAARTARPLTRPTSVRVHAAARGLHAQFAAVVAVSRCSVVSRTSGGHLGLVVQDGAGSLRETTCPSGGRRGRRSLGHHAQAEASAICDGHGAGQAEQGRSWPKPLTASTTARACSRWWTIALSGAVRFHVAGPRAGRAGHRLERADWYRMSSASSVGEQSRSDAETRQVPVVDTWAPTVAPEAAACRQVWAMIDGSPAVDPAGERLPRTRPQDRRSSPIV